MRSLYTEHAARGLPNPIPLEGEVRIIQDQDQQMLPHVVRENVTECLLTRSMLSKINKQASRARMWDIPECKLINDRFTRKLSLTITSKVKGQQLVNDQTYTM